MFLAWVAAAAALYVARDIAVPVVLAILLALLLRPVLRRLQRLRVPTVAASVLIVFVVAALLMSALMMLRHLGENDRADRILNAILRVCREGTCLTRDLGGSANTLEYASEVIRYASEGVATPA